MKKVQIVMRSINSGFVGIDLDTKKHVFDIDLFKLEKDFPTVGDVVLGDYKNGVFVATETILNR